jgi:hypothetical protein
MSWDPPGPRPQYRAPAPPTAPRPKHPWYRTPIDHIHDPKWNYIAEQVGCGPGDVYLVVAFIENSTAKERSHGSIGDFKCDECASRWKIAPDTIRAIYRALIADGYIDQGYIPGWTERNPEQQDPTATLRQKNRRRRIKAKQNAEAGHPTPEDLEWLSREDLAAYERFQALSRVTHKPAPVPVETPTTFRSAKPADDTPAAATWAKEINERAARAWLYGTGDMDWGHASAIVAHNLGATRLSADLTLRRWSEELDKDVVLLAEIISAANEQAITGQAFEAVVRQSIEKVVRERTAGLPLPFGLQSVGGRG